MKLHVFNPEHDIALAYNRPHLTMPHAAQELRMNLGWIPALWANDGDVVMVDDVPFALKAAKRSGLKTADVLYLRKDELKQMPFDEVCPWGWDLTLCTELLEHGVDKCLLPDENRLTDIRHISNRRKTTNTLSMLRLGIESKTCGESVYVTTLDLGRQMLKRWPHAVIKAPWSSSGRGIRYVKGELDEVTRNWIHRTMQRQGGVMVEPYYNKVKDFAMEFYVHEDNTTTFEGLSLFLTQHGAYTGNILATHEAKMEMLSRYVDPDVVNQVIDQAVKYAPHFFGGHYSGPVGVDMMIVARPDGHGFLLNPCVEVNVRRTMGHVALALTPEPTAPRQLMKIVHDVNYQLKVSNLESNFVQML